MVRTANVLVAILSCATTSTALACFAPPDSQPTSELSELRLPDRSPDPVVIHTVGNYEIHVKPQDLLAAMRPPSLSRWPKDTLGHRLESLLPLEADIDIREILTALAPEKPAPGEKDPTRRRLPPILAAGRSTAALRLE